MSYSNFFSFDNFFCFISWVWVSDISIGHICTIQAWNVFDYNIMLSSCLITNMSICYDIRCHREPCQIHKWCLCCFILIMLIRINLCKIRITRRHHSKRRQGPHLGMACLGIRIYPVYSNARASPARGTIYIGCV